MKMKYLSFRFPFNSIMDVECIDSGARLSTIVSCLSFLFIDNRT